MAWEPPASFEPEVLQAALAAIPDGAWSLPSTYQATGVHHGYRRVVLAGLPLSFTPILEAFAPIRDAWVSWIEPGGFIVRHRDAGPYYERWQVPLSTAGWTNQGSDAVATDGVPFRVEHWKPHSVSNPTSSPRVHLVIDRDVVADPDREPFCLFDKEPHHG